MPAPRAEGDSGGKIRLHCRYTAIEQLAAPTGVQVARVALGSVLPGWGALLATVAISGNADVDYLLPQTYPHGELVRLAVRTVAASGAVSESVTLAPVAAQTADPPAVSHVEGSQT